MESSQNEKRLLLFLRLTMAWTFLYAASHQVFDPKFTVVGFLSHTKTFHDFFAIFTTPVVASVTTFLVEYGHLLIGLSLLLGLLIRLSASFGVGLMILYWLAHMDWPFIENRHNFIIDYHIVYAAVLLLLIVKGAGDHLGLDAWAKNQPLVKSHPLLRRLFG